MTASSWPRVTWSAGRTTDLADASGDRGDHDVLHLHRLEGDDRVAGGDACPTAAWTVRTAPGIGATSSAGPVAPAAPWATAARAAASTSGGGASRNGDAPAGEVEMDGVAGADGRDRTCPA